MKKRNILISVSVLIVLFIMVFSLSACAGGADTSYDIVKQTKKDNFTLLNQRAEEGQIVMIGDSIIKLFPTYELFSDLNLTVYNRGISGDTSDRCLERFQVNALSAKPAAVSILIGTNDLSRGISTESIVKNVTDMLKAATDSGVKKMFVQSVYPVNASINKSMVGGRNSKDIIEINALLKSAAEANGAVYVDVYPLLCDKDGNFDALYTYDGLHPNAAGYVVIADAMTPIFKAI